MTDVLSGMPDFHDTLEFLRHKRQLSRESTATQAGFSISRLNEIIQHRTPPGPKLKKGLYAFFDLTPTQQRHLDDLLRPSATLPTITGLRQYLADQNVQTHLDHLDRCEVMGAYLDPLQNVLHANQAFYRMTPGLADADHNIVAWMCCQTARDLIEDWHEHLLYNIRNLRTSLGRYRDAPRARALFQTL
ncbi:MmyB family transcriptional regulator, partial [Nocardia thailandica]|uniref:MmyB family transcriptional regulator n=1 Tax=Nocardia thailandica TaxID=257275 RepID=UPI0005B8591E